MLYEVATFVESDSPNQAVDNLLDAPFDYGFRITDDANEAVIIDPNTVGKGKRPINRRTAEPTPVPSLIRRARRVAVAITAGIGLGSFVLSFAGLNDLVSRSGIPSSLAWIWPVTVDGTIIQATVAIIAFAPYPGQRRNRRFMWMILTSSAAVSVCGNILHALIGGPVPPVLAALIAAWPPLSLLATTHGLAVLTRFKPDEEVN